MNNIKAVIGKSKPIGTISAPPSKSDAHRLLICAALCKNQKCTIHGYYPSDDISATVDCIRTLGAKCEIDGEKITVTGCDLTKVKNVTLNCRESGSTLRFIIPLCMLCGNNISITGSERLLSRPLDVYKIIADENGINFRIENNILYINGKLNKNSFEIDSSVSSQFVTGLMLYSAVKGEKSTIKINKAASKPYIDMTAAVLKKFGVTAEIFDSEICIDGTLNAPDDVYVEGDWSGAAFFEALNLIGGNVNVTGLDVNSAQGDKIFSEIFNKDKIEQDISDCPDLAPIIMAVASVKNGCVLTGTRRLAYKESDRRYSMAQELSKFGIKTDIEDDRIIVQGGNLQRPKQTLESHNDHRIAMSLAVLLTLTGGEINGVQCVKKSMPDFFEKLISLGVEVICVEADS